MRNFSVWLIILLIPALAALGHDLYVAFDMQTKSFKDMGFHLTALGKFWVDYSVDTYKQVRNGTDPETWKTYVNPVLRQPAAVVALVWPLILTVIHLLMLVFGKEGPVRTMLARRSGPKIRKKRDFTYDDLTGGEKKMKYKRK